MNGVRIVKEKLPDTPWVLCGGGTANAEVSAGLGPIYWFINAEPDDSATYAGVDAVTEPEEVVELLKWRGEGLATLRMIKVAGFVHSLPPTFLVSLNMQVRYDRCCLSVH